MATKSAQHVWGIQFCQYPGHQKGDAHLQLPAALSNPALQEENDFFFLFSSSSGEKKSIGKNAVQAEKTFFLPKCVCVCVCVCLETVKAKYFDF